MALALALVALPAAADDADSHRWQRVLVGEQKIGHAEITRREEGERILESERVEIQLGAPGRRVLYRVSVDTESSRDGALLRLKRDVRTREGHSLVDARVQGEDLLIANGTGSVSSQTLVGAAHDLKSEMFAQAWLAAVARGESREPLSYRSWDPVKLAVVDVALARLPGAEVRVERRVRSARQATSTVQVLDSAGLVVRESLRIGSIDVTLVESSERDALARNDTFDHVSEQLQKSPYRIPASDMQAKIRYGFDNHGAAPQLPVGAGQRTWTNGQTTFIQVCAECALDPMAISADERRQALQATPWLQSGDVNLARRAIALTTGMSDDVARMRRLTRFVRDHMSVERIDMLGYGTALEAYATKRGDCTEYAVLLATLGRAAGIPTRVAIGRVYARHFEGRHHVFVPHAWVQAWNGSGWQSFDAAIGTFDSTHLAFAVSYDGSPANHFTGATLARELTLTSAARVVPRKSATN
ncbi:MAG TPA: transglutaminase-like domain-containing protein [Steroidobacteraceae bacterium]|nr:transglutaminase-like domain-containing protein [Steroidobacteraceae bacterium]